MAIELQRVEQALTFATPGTNLDYEVLLIIRQLDVGFAHDD
jgi:hypothetical protein